MIRGRSAKHFKLPSLEGAVRQYLDTILHGLLLTGRPCKQINYSLSFL